MHLALLACCALAAFAALRAVLALARAGLRARGDGIAQSLASLLLPNGEDRHTAWDLVRREGWGDLAAARTWGALAGLAALGALALALASP